jgi:hypothetical protein
MRDPALPPFTVNHLKREVVEPESTLVKRLACVPATLNAPRLVERTSVGYETAPSRL